MVIHVFGLRRTKQVLTPSWKIQNLTYLSAYLNCSPNSRKSVLLEGYIFLK